MTENVQADLSPVSRSEGGCCGSGRISIWTLPVPTERGGDPPPARLRADALVSPTLSPFDLSILRQAQDTAGSRHRKLRDESVELVETGEGSSGASFPKQTLFSPSFNGIGGGRQAHVGATGRSPLRPLRGGIKEQVFPWIPVFTGMTEGGGNDGRGRE